MAIAFDKNSKTYQRIKNRYKSERLKQFTQINTAHSLGLTQEWLEREADAYADYKASSEVFLFSELDVFSMIMFSVGAILTAVFTIVFPPAGWLGWTYFGISVAAQAGTLALTMTQQGFLDQVAAFTTAQIQNTQLQSSLTKSTLERQSGQLSDFLIFAPYEICATGSVYKAGCAGSESFNPTKAYDPTQGLRGDFATSPIDDTLQNRAHKSLAGNASYDAHANPLPIPKAKAQLDFSQNQQGIKSSIKSANEDINEGYMKLSKEFFGFFENGKHIESYHKHSIDKRIAPLKNRYCVNDFLEKLKNYAKGLRADFFYETLKEKRLTLEERQQILEETLKHYKDKLEAAASDKIAQGAIFLEMGVGFVEGFYKTLAEQTSRDIKGNSHDESAYPSKKDAENLFNGWSGDSPPFFARNAYFLNGKTQGLPPPVYSFVGNLYKTCRFVDEPFAKQKLKLDFYALGWSEILHEFDEIYNNILKQTYRLDGELRTIYSFALLHSQRAYWVAWDFPLLPTIYDDKIFHYLVDYTLHTPSVELFLKLRDKRPQLTPSEWEQAYRVYTGVTS
ncbi:hypothetical protein [Helicobacter sp.]|uniref:hypothetical protein n=1 Tax=Helicobacter sp. TaxID=218 RepID=UPI00388FC1C5